MSESVKARCFTERESAARVMQAFGKLESSREKIVDSYRCVSLSLKMDRL